MTAAHLFHGISASLERFPDVTDASWLRAKDPWVGGCLARLMSGVVTGMYSVQSSYAEAPQHPVISPWLFLEAFGLQYDSARLCFHCSVVPAQVFERRVFARRKKTVTSTASLPAIDAEAGNGDAEGDEDGDLDDDADDDGDGGGSGGAYAAAGAVFASESRGDQDGADGAAAGAPVGAIAPTTRKLPTLQRAEYDTEAVESLLDQVGRAVQRGETAELLKCRRADGAMRMYHLRCLHARCCVVGCQIPFLRPAAAEGRDALRWEPALDVAVRHLTGEDGSKHRSALVELAAAPAVPVVQALQPHLDAIATYVQATVEQSHEEGVLATTLLLGVLRLPAVNAAVATGVVSVVDAASAMFNRLVVLYGSNTVVLVRTDTGCKLASRSVVNVPLLPRFWETLSGAEDEMEVVAPLARYLVMQVVQRPGVTLNELAASAKVLRRADVSVFVRWVV